MYSKRKTVRFHIYGRAIKEIKFTEQKVEWWSPGGGWWGKRGVAEWV